jgi:hypothetical protein
MKIARRILSMLHEEALIGDIEEEYIARRREFGSRAAFRWYCREVTMATLHALANRKVTMRQPLGFTLALGVGGGLLLAASQAFTQGPAVLVIYALVPVFAAFYLRLVPVDGFIRRYLVGVGSFMLATVIVYISLNFMLGLGRISWWGHAWRLGLMFIIGSGLAASIVQIMTPATVSDGPSGKQHPIAFTLALGAFGGAALWVSLFGKKMWWASTIAACALILLIAAWYLSRERIPGFWSRYAITASSYVLAMAIIITIMFMNMASHMSSARLWRWIGPPLAVGLLGGCLLSFLVAQLTVPEPAAS